jgi:hypothetical protein
MAGGSLFLPQGTDRFVSRVATFSVIGPSANPWPLLNVPAVSVCVFPQGHSHPIDVWHYDIGDAGVVIIGRCEDGRFGAYEEGA